MVKQMKQAKICKEKGLSENDKPVVHRWKVFPCKLGQIKSNFFQFYNNIQ